MERQWVGKMVIQLDWKRPLKLAMQWEFEKVVREEEKWVQEWDEEWVLVWEEEWVLVWEQEWARGWELNHPYPCRCCSHYISIHDASWRVDTLVDHLLKTFVPSRQIHVLHCRHWHCRL